MTVPHIQTSLVSKDEKERLQLESEKDPCKYPWLTSVHSGVELRFTTGKMGDCGGNEEENMAAWLTAANTLCIKPFKLTALGDNDVKVKMKAVGICGSDVHFYRHMRLAEFFVNEPMVIGHECAGIVAEVGSQVRHLKVGDNVALEPGISCNRCIACKGGQYNLCPDMKFFATPPVHGSLANYVVHSADLCFKLPDSVSLEEGAMCEPLSVAVHACRRAGICPDTHVLVMGAGPIGLVTLLTAKAFGAPYVAITDVDQRRLQFAKQLGAHATFLVSNNTKDATAEAEALRELMPGGNIDVAMDCAGFEKTMTTSLRAVRPGGKVCLIGMGHNEMRLPITGAAAAREVDVIGSWRYRNTYKLCIQLLASGKVDVKPLITHRFGFSQQELTDAFETSSRGGEAVKVMFKL